MIVFKNDGTVVVVITCSMCGKKFEAQIDDGYCVAPVNVCDSCGAQAGGIN